MIKINDKEFNGEAYITCDPASGVWIWQFKPILGKVNNLLQWVTPKELRGNQTISSKFEKVDNAILALLLNIDRSNHNEMNDTILDIFNGTRIFKIKLEEINSEEDGK